jgi:TetR/AcrR family transcriptional regulator, repressor for uid operon
MTVPLLAAEQKEERRNNIILAAWRCAGKKGFHELTIDEICDEAGVSKGSFYGYFESKQELLVALLEDEAAGRLAILEALGNVSTGVNRLQAFARAMLERGEDPARVQVLADLWATIGNETPVREAFSASVNARRSVLREWIDAAVDDEELVDLPPNALASILIALGDGLILHAALDPTAFQWRNVRKVLLMLLEGVRR